VAKSQKSPALHACLLLDDPHFRLPFGSVARFSLAPLYSVELDIFNFRFQITAGHEVCKCFFNGSKFCELTVRAVYPNSRAPRSLGCLAVGSRWRLLSEVRWRSGIVSDQHLLRPQTAHRRSKSPGPSALITRLRFLAIRFGKAPVAASEPSLQQSGSLGITTAGHYDGCFPSRLRSCEFLNDDGVYTVAASHFLIDS